MKRFFSKLSVICICIVIACMSLGTGLVTNAASSDPQIISKIVTLPANNKAITMGQCRKTFADAKTITAPLLLKKAKLTVSAKCMFAFTENKLREQYQFYLQRKLFCQNPHSRK